MKQLCDASPGVHTTTEVERLTRLRPGEQPGHFDVELPEEWASLAGW